MYLWSRLLWRFIASTERDHFLMQQSGHDPSQWMIKAHHWCNSLCIALGEMTWPICFSHIAKGATGWSNLISIPEIGSGHVVDKWLLPSKSPAALCKMHVAGVRWTKRKDKDLSLPLKHIPCSDYSHPSSITSWALTGCWDDFCTFGPNIRALVAEIDTKIRVLCIYRLQPITPPNLKLIKPTSEPSKVWTVLINSLIVATDTSKSRSSVVVSISH